MFIKQFRSVDVKVPDPLRPGKRAIEERLMATGGTQISHEGFIYDADEDGWFEVDHEMGAKLLAFRHPNGEHFCTPEQVDEQVRLGAVSGEDEGLPRRRRQPDHKPGKLTKLKKLRKPVDEDEPSEEDDEDE